MSFLAITPNDSAPLPSPVLRIYVGVSGSITLSGYHDPIPVTLTAVPVGWLVMPMPVVQVWATGTTASALVSAGVL